MPTAEDNSPQADADHALAEFEYTLKGNRLKLTSRRIIRDIQRLIIPTDEVNGLGISLTYSPKRVEEGNNEFNLSEISKVIFMLNPFEEYDRAPSGTIEVKYQIIPEPTVDRVELSGLVRDGKVSNKTGDVLTFSGTFNYGFSVPLKR